MSRTVKKVRSAIAHRPRVADARRIVIKIGSRTLASDESAIARLAHSIAQLHADGRHVVLVSSGAIALGMAKLGFARRPKEMARLQAAAAAGQSLLMRSYEEAFSAEKIAVAQVLLTHSDLANRERANNARAALGALIDAKAVPILNENDSVATDEIRFGDNDQLASMVVPLVDADLLILLSDVEGLLDSNGVRVAIVSDVARDATPHIRASTSNVGTGGMASKVEAARRATMAGADVVIGDARQVGAIEAICAGEDVGTHFVVSESPLGARKVWIAFTLRPKGDIVLDAGAAKAVKNSGKSVLSVGVLGVRGSFAAGDSVRILDTAGAEIGRGLARCSAVDALAVAGSSKTDLPVTHAEFAVLIHRDELVVFR